MQIVVLANIEQEQEIKVGKNLSDKIDFAFISDVSEINAFKNADAFFLFAEDVATKVIESIPGKPVIINSVTDTLKSLKLRPNVSRINGWPGFLKRPIWEVASNEKDTLSNLFRLLGWEYCFVKDEPGLVAARVLSMIINEAYFALGEDISTREEIDLAMKLGTNYPYGPFEWEDKIGTMRIYELLKKLSEMDTRYAVAPSFEEKFSSINS
ncbi:MAG: 3-hydroxyacyl-CoA dehydrogenase family protein [Ginsengibacter sp.]